jgi:Histidine kinase-, DNA gyrase B-, and HSP90-like ATPase
MVKVSAASSDGVKRTKGAKGVQHPPSGRHWGGIISLATTELERLRQEKAILERVVRLTGDGIVVLGADGRVRLRHRAVVLGLHLERVDLVEATRRAAADYLRDPTRRVSLEPPEEPLEVSVDPLRLSQILMNLLSNAHKYSPPDTPIRLRLWREGGWAKVSVIDQGHGIPSEELERIFDKFHRIEDPMTMTATGTGLGSTSRESSPAPWAARWTPPTPPAAPPSPCASPGPPGRQHGQRQLRSSCCRRAPRRGPAGPPPG